MTTENSSAVYHGSPESFLTIPAVGGLPIDAIYCALRRAKATTGLLLTQFDGECDSRMSDEIICGALCSIEGYLTMLEKMIDAGDEMLPAVISRAG